MWCISGLFDSRSAPIQWPLAYSAILHALLGVLYALLGASYGTLLTRSCVVKYWSLYACPGLCDKPWSCTPVHGKGRGWVPGDRWSNGA